MRNPISCLVCKKIYNNIGNFEKHCKTNHFDSYKKYIELKDTFFSDNKISCLICNKEITDYIHLYSHIGRKHKEIDLTPVRELSRLIKQRKKSSNEELISCKICGHSSRALFTHIKIHKITTEQYLNKFNLKIEDIQTKEYLNQMSNRVKGENNPAFNHNGKYSSFSKNFIKYENLTEEGKKEEIEKICKISSISKQNHPENDSTHIEYWLKLGFNKEESEKKLSERQNTFTLEKCIEKYDLEEGTKVYNERQIKWQEKLKSKSPEELVEINNKKLPSLENFIRKYGNKLGIEKWEKFLKGKHKHYSKISQLLFIELLNHIKNDFREIHFATCKNTKENNEYYIKTKRSYRMFDFYIKDNNICIEFDGDYWHGSKGNKEREKQREQEIIEVNPTLKILHVREFDYRKNKEKVIEECLKFIYQNK